MEKDKQFILWFDQISIEDVSLVGGKNASLGEMYRTLAPKGVNIPNGFAVTASAYLYFIEKSGIAEQIKAILSDLNTGDMKNLAARGKKVRETILKAELPEELKKVIVEAYGHLCLQYGKDCDVAVRSSATAEDLPDASFAGQQETYLNIRGSTSLIEACKKCFASLFTDRAISYRVDKGFDYFKIALSIGVEKMVRSDKACSGVMFSIDTESGFKDVVFINGSYGLGENIVQGAVNPDEYYVFKPTLKQGKKPILSKVIGDKKIKMVYTKNQKKHTKNIAVMERDRKKFCLADDEILILAKWACIIEDHYTEKRGHYTPMDMEWAKDGDTNKLFIVQARPETVHSQKNRNILEEYTLLERGDVLVKGHSVGEKIGKGEAHIIKDVKQIGQFKEGQVLITDMTDPDWEPIMKIAAAIVTNRGGRTCFSGDTMLLTNRGFIRFDEVFKNYDGLYVPSLNRNTIKIEWKPIIAVMKRKSEVIEVAVSQTGRMKGNALRLTPDHRMLTYTNRKLVSKEIQQIIKDEDALLIAEKIPALTKSSERDRKLAYLLGAISTDGHIYLTRTHGEVQFIQKPTEEKEEFISAMRDYMKDVFNKSFAVSKKKTSSGMIRDKPAVGNANVYRCYSKLIATQMLEKKQNLVSTLLSADKEVILNFLAGVIDGDGTYNQKANRINIYCSNKSLLEAIVVSCLRLGTTPQISTNRSIFNIQIVEKIDEFLEYTKRVKGVFNRRRQGTRFFSAKQLLGDIVGKVNYKGRIKSYVNNNLLIDGNKIKERVLGLCGAQAKAELWNILASDTCMKRVNFSRNLGFGDVYNITVEDNHNYVVFTDRYTPILVNNCHAAIISRELGIPCIVGTNNGTEILKNHEKITISCAEGEEGFVYKGLLRFEIKKTDLQQMPKPNTKIMMNVGNPEQAFELSFIPNDGVGLAREEFIINEYIKIHPKALMHFNRLKDKKAKKIITDMTFGYKNKSDYFVDKLTQGISIIAAAFYPKPVILRFSDFKSNEYRNLIGGKEFEPIEDNPMIGWRGASRYYDGKYKEAFALECRAIKRAREEMGLTNLVVMIPFCRTVEEGKKVLAEMEKNELKKGENGLQAYVMCEIPSNVVLADQFSEIFDGFSIGSNDLTQLTLGLDRDSELVSGIYDERNEAVKRLIRQVIKTAKEKGRKIGICGEAASIPEFARFLVECGIDSVSTVPDASIKTRIAVYDEEKKLGLHN